MRALVLCVVVLALLLVSREGMAAARCSDAAREFVRACSEQSGLALDASRCPTGHLILRVGGDVQLELDVARASPRAFLNVGSQSVSPIGDFPDWETGPAERRAALAAVAECLQTLPAVELGKSRRPPSGGASQFGRRTPWALFGLAALCIVALGLVLRRLGARRVATHTGLGLMGTALVFAVRRAVWTPELFHQNGHGATWISAALNRYDVRWHYGPGFPELFGPLLWLRSSPDDSVFLVASVLGATVPVMAFVASRAVAASRGLGLAIAAVLTVEPILVRMAGSESYFGVGTALGFAAAAVLCVGTRAGSPFSLRFVTAAAIAGMLIAQALRTHPLTWLPCAMLPGIMLVAPGSLRRRLLATLVAASTVTVVVLSTSGSALWEVARGELGARWLPEAASSWSNISSKRGVWAVVLLLGVVGCFVRGPRSLFGAVTVLGAAGAGDVLAQPNDAIAAAWYRLFWPLLTVWFAAFAVRVERRALGRWGLPRRVRHPGALLVALAGGVFCAATWSARTTLPTDALEARFAREWRTGLPTHARVTYLRCVGQRCTALPLYPGVTAVPHAVMNAADIVDVSELDGDVYYYRSSLCSTPEGAPQCRALESGAALEVVVERDLPAISSMRWDSFPSPHLRVALYRVRSRAESSAGEGQMR